MSARDKLVELVLKNEPDYGNAMFVDLLGCAMTAEEMKGSVLLWLDAYRAEVLREAADRLEAIDPIEFALGSTDPTTELRRMAQGDTP
jgi:hypothetical protein